MDAVAAFADAALTGEDKRAATLDGKANTLLGAVGLALSVMFAFGGDVLLGHPQYLAPLGPTIWYCSVALLGSAIVSAFGAGCFACQALRVRADYKALATNDVLNPAVLEEADRHGGEAAAAYYNRYMLGSTWQMYQKHFSVHERKATAVRRGQGCYLAFLCHLLVVGVTFVGAALKEGPTMSQPSSSSQSTNQSPTPERPPPTPVPSGGVSVSKSEKPAPTPVPTGGQVCNYSEE